MFFFRSRTRVDVTGLSESDAEALRSASEAVADEPHDLRRRRALADLCAHLGRKDEAVGHYQAIAGVYAAQGLLFRAIAVCKTILELDPDHHETAQTLAALYAAHEERTAPPSGPASPPNAPPPPPREEDVALPSAMGAAFTNEEGVALLEPLAANDAAAGDVIDASALAAVTLVDQGSVRLLRPAAVPLFSGLSQQAFTELVRGLRAWVAEPGAVIIAEGEAGASVFVIAAGRVAVERAGEAGPVAVGTLSTGDFFGEIAIVIDRPRSATVTAVTKTQLLEIDRRTLGALCARDPQVTAVLEEFCAQRLLQSTVRTSPLFEGLDDAGYQRALARFEVLARAAATTLIEQGAPTPGLMVILAGGVDVIARSSSGPVRLKQLGAGDVFGEMGLITGRGASARCVTTERTRLAVLSRAALQALQPDLPALRRRLAEIVSERTAWNARFVPDLSDDARPAAV